MRSNVKRVNPLFTVPEPVTSIMMKHARTVQFSTPKPPKKEAIRPVVSFFKRAALAATIFGI